MNRIAKSLALAATAAACAGFTLVGGPAQAASGHSLDGGRDGCATSTRPSAVVFRSVIILGVEKTQVRQREVACGYYTSQWVIMSRGRWVTLPVPV